MLLHLSTVTYYEEGQAIFHQGDIGDTMYIIIRGGCHVKVNRKNADGTENSVVVASLYDGKAFGELSLMQF